MTTNSMPGQRGYWRGPTFPFQFDGGNDFTVASDSDQLKAAIKQVLMTHGRAPTHEGECPWDTGFGSLLDYLRHSTSDETTMRDMATYYIGDAIRQYEPRIMLRGISLKKYDDKVEISVLFSTASGAQGRDAVVEQSTVVLSLEA